MHLLTDQMSSDLTLPQNIPAGIKDIRYVNTWKYSSPCPLSNEPSDEVVRTRKRSHFWHQSARIRWLSIYLERVVWFPLGWSLIRPGSSLWPSEGNLDRWTPDIRSATIKFKSAVDIIMQIRRWANLNKFKTKQNNWMTWLLSFEYFWWNRKPMPADRWPQRWQVPLRRPNGRRRSTKEVFTFFVNK